MFRLSKLLALPLLLTVFATAPSSTSYTLKAYEFGNGGNTSNDGTLTLNGTAGSQTGPPLSSTAYALKPGEKAVQTANVPLAPTVTNPNNYYNKLQLVINTANNPSDTKYLIAVSSDNFSTTYYLQSDGSLHTPAVIADYQTYTAWGGATGVTITPLTPGTSYQAKVSALEAGFTGSAYGPASTAVATSQPTISFALSTSLTATPPFSVNFTSLSPNTVFAGDATAIATISTNANNGGNLYINDSNNGLKSTSHNNVLSALTGDLSALGAGYGAQVSNVSQTSGATVAKVSPFNGVSNNVGILTTALQSFATVPAPVTGGSATITFKAKSSTVTPAADDYKDSLTLVAGMNF